MPLTNPADLFPSDALFVSDNANRTFTCAFWTFDFHLSKPYSDESCLRRSLASEASDLLSFPAIPSESALSRNPSTSHTVMGLVKNDGGKGTRWREDMR